MAEHSIIFSTEMVRAVLTCAKCGNITIEVECPKCGSLERRKTQTRRIAKLPEKWHRGFRAFEKNPNGAEEFVIHGDCGTKTTYCPYGQVGDRLWVRETFWLRNHGNTYRGLGIDYKAGGHSKHIAKPKGVKGLCKWKPAILMPKWAARIWLEITNIRVERVQDISYEDAVKEGIDPSDFPCNCVEGGCIKINGEFLCDKYISPKHHGESAQAYFGYLWDSLNAKRGYGWDKNTWVWVIEFKR